MFGGLLLGLSSPDAQRQILGLEAERSLGGGALAALLNSSDDSVAQRAALAIGRTRNPAGTALLEPHLHDARVGVRAMSAYGLGLIGTGAANDVLARLAVSDPSGAVRLAAIDALERYESDAILDGPDERRAYLAVKRALRSDVDSNVRGRAAIALNAFADGPQGANAAAALSAAANGSERASGVRRRIMWSIFRRFASRVPRAVLRRNLHDADEVVRIEAVRAYGRLKRAGAMADILPLLGDPSWRVQEQAAESIRALRGKPPATAWTAIPRYVHTPAPAPDPLAAETPVPRPSAFRLGPPSAANADLGPMLSFTDAASMVTPARGAHPRLRIVTTKGNIYVVLYPEWAPLTVANFIDLLNAGFLDNNRWFRIVPDFVVQTGEQDDVKQPGPGYTIGAEENPLEQNSYVLSMGLDYDPRKNTPLRDSAGSEYYITLSPQYHLDNDFTVFGAVSAGYDVLGRLVQSDRVVRVERIGDATL